MSAAGVESIRSGLRATGAPGAFWRELLESFRHPDFWAMSSWLDIIIRARKSRLGILWLLMPSIVYVFGMGSFFASIMGGGPGFYAYVALGAMVFRSLMSAIIGSANVFIGSAAFIMDGHMRLTDYLLQSLAKSFFDFCMYLPVLALALYLSWPVVDAVGLLWTIPALALVYLNALWIAAVFALLGARLPDVGQLLANISIFAFLLTPIIWHTDMVPAGSLRERLMHWNPFYHFVEIFRAPVLGEAIDPSSFHYVGAMTALGLVAATLLYRRYARFVPLWI